MNPIIVSSHESPYGELANFYSSPIKWNGKMYPTAEHLYHARKYIYPGASQRCLDYAEEIRKTSTPYKSKILGIMLHYTRYKWQKDLSIIINKYSDIKLNPLDVEDRRFMIMYETIKCKIEQNKHCRDVLLSTGDAYIIKIGHPYWGMEQNGGENQIGNILMMLRSEIGLK